MTITPSAARKAAICLVLLALTLAAFWGILGNGFIDYDDPQYVTANVHVTSGLSLDNALWAFTSGHAANWHPLTWLSHQLDVEIFGLDPRGHHLVSLILHGANACLLFLVLSAMTGALWRSLLVAALFAVHPLHVESVAWVAERKDVLSAFFGMLALACYLRYAKVPSLGRYLLLCLFFALSLMSKPMLVTLPFALLLLDYWPLGRVAGVSPADRDEAQPAQLPLPRLVVEKLPLLALSALSSIVTIVVQSKGEAVHTLELTPFPFRVANALVAYLRYLGKMIWPRDLAVLYPIPKEIPLWESAGSALLLALACWGVLALARRRPYLPVGWFWFLGTLVPVIGLVQVGLQSMADRYAYFPMIGLLIAAVWGGSALISWRPALKLPLAGAAGLAVLCFAALSFQYQSQWQDSTTLFSHALAVTDDNYYTHHLLGNALYQEGHYQEALAQQAQAISLAPRFAEAYLNSAITYAKLGDLGQAGNYFAKALELKPGSSYLHYNLALSLQKQGRMAEALSHYNEVLRLDPESAEAHANLGVVLMDLGRLDEAAGQLAEALRLRPDLEQARLNLQECRKLQQGR